MVAFHRTLNLVSNLNKKPGQHIIHALIFLRLQPTQPVRDFLCGRFVINPCVLDLEAAVPSLSDSGVDISIFTFKECGQSGVLTSVL